MPGPLLTMCDAPHITFLGFLSSPPAERSDGSCSRVLWSCRSVLPCPLVVLWYCPSELTAVRRRTRARMLQSYPAIRRHGGEVNTLNAQKIVAVACSHADPCDDISCFMGCLTAIRVWSSFSVCLCCVRFFLFDFISSFVVFSPLRPLFLSARRPSSLRHVCRSLARFCPTRLLVCCFAVLVAAALLQARSTCLSQPARPNFDACPLLPSFAATAAALQLPLS